MVVRHPLAASVLALAAVTWLKLGWVALVALVLAAVVMLAGLAVVLAGLVLPVGRPPGPAASGGPGATGAAGPRS